MARYLEPCKKCDGTARALFIVCGAWNVARYECGECGARFVRIATEPETLRIVAAIDANETETQQRGNHGG